MATIPDPPAGPPDPAQLRAALRAGITSWPESLDTQRRSRKAREALDARPGRRLFGSLAGRAPRTEDGQR